MRQSLPRPLKADKVYQEFKAYCQKAEAKGTPIADVLADMRQLTTHFVHFYFEREQDEQLLGAFKSLRVLTDGATSLALRLYEFYTAGVLSRDDFVEIVRTLESYLFRRMVCDFPSNSLPQIFALLTNSIQSDNTVQTIKVLLHRFSKRRRFPTDQEFRDAMLTRDIYSMKACKFLLDRLENDSKEQVDTSSLTVEHVMPQTEILNQKWRDALGEDWKERHATWLHRLGNLTLTAYNREYSNRWFDEKKTIDHGFNESPLRLNQFIKQQTTWNVELIEERGKELAKHALQLWKPLTVADKVLHEFELQQAKEIAQNYSEDHVEGLDVQQALFDALSQRIRELGDDVVELFSPKNVTYRVFDFFVQILPRKQRLDIVLNLDFEEIDDPHEFCRDRSQQSYVANCSVEGGVLLRVRDLQDIDETMNFIAVAYDNVSD